MRYMWAGNVLRPFRLAQTSAVHRFTHKEIVSAAFGSAAKLLKLFIFPHDQLPPIFGYIRLYAVVRAPGQI